MLKRHNLTNGRLALILTPRGIDNVVFASSDRREALQFYLLIEEELKKFEETISQLVQKRARENGKQ